MRESNKDYGGHKEDIRKHYLSLGINEKSINKFMDYYSQTYDKYKKGFFPPKLAWWLYDRRSWVKKDNQHYWIAFIGRTGGEGKSTLAKNVLYFLDPTFNEKRISLNYDDFILNIKKSVKEVDYPSNLLDEPENKTHQFSKKGRDMKDILGKIRQLNLFVGICANSLSEIPTFMYNRINAIFFLTNNHRFWFWDSSKDSPKFTVVNDIKKRFGRDGHSVFLDKEFLKRAYLKNQHFSEELPFENKNYLKKKKQDLITDIDNFVNKDGKHEVRKYMKELNRKLRIEGRGKIERGKILGVSRRTVYTYDESDKKNMGSGK